MGGLLRQTTAYAVSVLFTALAHSAPSLETIMQDPDWIGPPVEAAWWQFGDDSYAYQTKAQGNDMRELYRWRAGQAAAEQLADESYLIDGPRPQLSANGQWLISLHEGVLVLRSLTTGVLKPLYVGREAVTRAHFGSDSAAIFFLTQGQWWRTNVTGETAHPITDLRFEAPPFTPADDLEAEQLALFSTLEKQRKEQELAHEKAIKRSQASAHLGAAPWYLGADYQANSSQLSVDGRWLAVAVQTSSDTGGKDDKMPHYVTRSGYVEVEDVRRLVGKNPPSPEQVWLLDLHTRERYTLDLSFLSGRDDDPLTELKEAQGLSVHNAESLRPLSIDNLVWHPEKPELIIQAIALDHKDRWTVRVRAEDLDLKEIDRYQNPAWVSWDLNDVGWVPGTDTIWLISEKSGYAHVYTAETTGEIHPVTEGEFEVRDVAFSPDGTALYALSNREHPSEWDVYRLAMDSGSYTQITALKGVESFQLHPTQPKLLVRHSSSYIPAQATVVDVVSGDLSRSTDTRTDTYRELDWQMPTYVGVPSTHGAEQPIWSKFYPANPKFEGPRPAVMFVHGAGYTQNTHHKFPYYFREQMFHNLLTERGYHVLDMDYRASKGYGRDWRTAIYRHMGKPELEDYIDGVRYLVDQHNADPKRIGIYGGSYGGFMAFMAMFNAPDVFTAGAALRPVTDWRHYNHGYTSRILNTPEVDPEAHRRSSPIEFVEGLSGHLLISHGMLDDNVFYKDSVRLAQRLIEHRKTNWELASYPLEPHGYIYEESWLDQYRRILKLFETVIGDSDH